MYKKCINSLHSFNNENFGRHGQTSTQVTNRISGWPLRPLQSPVLVWHIEQWSNFWCNACRLLISVRNAQSPIPEMWASKQCQIHNNGARIKLLPFTEIENVTLNAVKQLCLTRLAFARCTFAPSINTGRGDTSYSTESHNVADATTQLPGNKRTTVATPFTTHTHSQSKDAKTHAVVELS